MIASITPWVEAYRLMTQILGCRLDEVKLAEFIKELESARGFDRTDLILRMKRDIPAYRTALNTIIERIMREKMGDCPTAIHRGLHPHSCHLPK
jgi:hypothetical protein